MKFTDKDSRYLSVRIINLDGVHIQLAQFAGLPTVYIEPELDDEVVYDENNKVLTILRGPANQTPMILEYEDNDLYLRERGL